ncbi:glycosyltransferase family 32 protein [Butyrivibrio sp. JL13D10]|uniref:glycosyltransferase family 32 protein n=1 Tax=Butyrivibrio sp. JL13D10 TaxID=3236815 RepID=UPI0038B4B3FE
MSVPKIIHYCWFSDLNKKNKGFPKDVNYCIETWKNILKDYRIIEWNQSNFDISKSPLYVQEAYNSGKYAFVSDYVRVWALFNYGGIYLDTDVEVYKDFDEFLNSKGFFGFETTKHIGTCILASESHNSLFYEILQEYGNKRFIKENGEYDETPNPSLLTNKLLEKGLALNNQYQKVDDFDIYPMDYFCPFNPYRESGSCFSKRTVINHHFSGSWKTPSELRIGQIRRFCKKRFGDRIGWGIARIICIPFYFRSRIDNYGCKSTLKYYLRKINKRKRN